MMDNAGGGGGGGGGGEFQGGFNMSRSFVDVSNLCTSDQIDTA